jgi:hypothetical protein
MNETAMALDCLCGHSERHHLWNPVVLAPFTRIAGCSFTEPLPREGDEPMVRFKSCDCFAYSPNKSESDA